jgi:group I intron endonuclease
LVCEVGIYGIHNVITDKWYVVSSLEMTKRWRRHLWELRNGRHHSPKLQRSLDKHGEAAFQLVLLGECSEAELETLETEALQRFNSKENGYNIAGEAKGGFMRGRQWPEATKAARVEAMKGFKHTEVSRGRIKDALASRTDEEKAAWAAKIGAANSKPMSAEGAARIAAATLKRMQATDPEARKQNVLKGHATRRANKLAKQLALAEKNKPVTTIN